MVNAKDRNRTGKGNGKHGEHPVLERVMPEKLVFE